MKHIRLFAFLVAANLAVSACAKPAATATSSTPSIVDLSSMSASVAKTAASYDLADLVENVAFARTVTVDLASGTASGASASETVKKTAFGLTIDSTGNEPVKFELTGSFAGTLTVKSAATYALFLDGISITATAGPALDLESKTKAFIVTENGSVNSLADSAERDKSMKQKGALYCAGSLVFGGTGSLSVTGNYKHGILADDRIRVTGGTIDVTVSVKNAIQTVNAFVFDDGSLTVKATGDALGEESKGIKVDGSDTASGAGKGYIYVNGGAIDITSVSKGITAAWDIDEDASKDFTAGNPDPFIEINSGAVKVTTTGKVIEAGSVADDPEASCSPEGIEGKSRVTINGGSISVTTADDCLNAGESIVVNGGYVYAMSSDNDAIDSNGTITITGGVIVAGGTNVPEEAFDCDTNVFTITGGTIVGIAGTTSEPTASSCTQNVIVLGGGPAGSTFALRAKDGTVAFAFDIPRDYGTMVVSSPSIKTGVTYVPVTGATLSGDSVFNGLYMGKLKASGGTDGTAFTVSSVVTVSGVTMMGPGGPGGPGGMGGMGEPPEGTPPDGVPPDGVPPDGGVGAPPAGQPPKGPRPTGTRPTGTRPTGTPPTGTPPERPTDTIKTAN